MSTIFELYMSDHSSESPLDVEGMIAETDPLVGTGCREEVVQALLEETIRDTIVSVYMTSPRAAYHEGLSRKIELLDELWPLHPPIEVMGPHAVRVVVQPEVSRARLHAALGILRSGNGMGADWHWMNDYASLTILEAAEADDTPTRDYYGSFDFLFNVLPATVLYETCQRIDWMKFHHDRLVTVYRLLSEGTDPAPAEVTDRLHRYICSKRARPAQITWGEVRSGVIHFKKDNRETLSSLSTIPTDILVLQYIQSQQRSPS